MTGQYELYEQQTGLGYAIFKAAQTLLPTEVKEIESHLRKYPDNLEKRLSLLGFYQVSPADKTGANWNNHLSEIIRRHPESYLPSLCMTTPRMLAAKDFAQLRDQWLVAVAENLEIASVNGNAATFIKQRDFETANRLFKSAASLEPENAIWQRYLYLQHCGEARRFILYREENAEKAFTHAEMCLSLLSKRFRGERNGVLINAGEIALLVQNFGLAEEYYKRALNEAQGNPVFTERAMKQLKVLARASRA